jgi:hypothetical protein
LQLLAIGGDAVKVKVNDKPDEKRATEMTVTHQETACQQHPSNP